MNYLSDLGSIGICKYLSVWWLGFIRWVSAGGVLGICSTQPHRRHQPQPPASQHNLIFKGGESRRLVG